MSFWEEHYQSGDMPWEKGRPSPGLVDFLQLHSEFSTATVCVPGCGTAHDARLWASHGFDVTAVDLAPTALRLAREKNKAAGLSMELLQTDFLRDSPPKPFDWLFEHTLFCAIQPGEREAYVEAVRRWLRPEGSFLAVFYMIDDEDGPPFGSTQEEILARFTPHFQLIRDWVPRSYPNRTGLEWMTWWRLVHP